MMRPFSWLLRRVIPPWLVRYRLDRCDQGEVLLTFDDGPDPETTPRVLELLARYHVRALFFIVGNRIHRAPGVLPQIVAQGHLVGNHSFSHEGTLGIPFSRYCDDLERCQGLIEGHTGCVPRFFRPPYGRIAPAALRAARRTGLQTICWSAEGGEFGHSSTRPWNVIAERLCSCVRGRDIVLLHDNYPHCAEVLEVLLPALAQRGLRLGPGGLSA